MPNDEKEQLLIQLRTMSRLLKDGRYNEIDLTSIEKDAADMVRNFVDVIGNLKSIAEELDSDRFDLPLITRHLNHISETTESGVLDVLNTAEAMMDDSNNITDSLEKIQQSAPDHAGIQTEVETANTQVDEIRNKCFSILTKLEFEDINRQLMEKIVLRLDEMYGNLLNLLGMIHYLEDSEKKQSPFLESLKHITDIDNADRQSQDMIDVLFEDFS